MELERDHDRTSAREAALFFALSVAVLCYLVLRALRVPLIHDEANSFWWFASTGEFLPYRSLENTGNHFLNSLLGWIGQGLFGPRPWALRIGSLLAFPLYAWSCWNLTTPIHRGLVRWAVLLALLWCPFLTDYFALFRGYGPGLACFLWALVHGLRCVERPSATRAAYAALGMAGATFANLSYLPLWALSAAGLLVLAFRAKRSGAPMLPWLLLTAAQLTALSFAIGLAVHFAGSGQLDFGHREGIIGTVGALCAELFGGGTALAWCAMVMAIGATLVALRERRWNDPLLALCGLWWAEIGGRWALHAFFGIAAPPERAALYLVPLWCILVARAIDRLAERRIAWQWAAVLFVAFPVSMSSDLNLEVVRGSTEQGIPPHFIAYASGLQQRLGRPLTIGSCGAVRATWAFAAQQAGAPANDVEDQALLETQQDLRVLPTAVFRRGAFGYHVVDSTARGGLVLVERDRPLELVLIHDTVLPDVRGKNDFIGLYEADTTVHHGDVLFVRAEGRMTVHARVSDVRVIASVLGPDGQLGYDDHELRHDRAAWNGERFDVMRILLPRPAAVRRTCYVWNTSHALLELHGLRVRVYVARPTRPPLGGQEG